MNAGPVPAATAPGVRALGGGSLGGQAPPLVPAPAPARVVRPPRQASARSVLGALLVIVLGGLVVAWAVPAYGGRVPVLVMARDVPVGAVVTDADLGVAGLTVDPAVAVVPEADRATVVGKTALVALPRGGVLAPSQVGDARPLGAGEVLVALPVKAGQVPARGLAPGDKVLVVPAPPDPNAAAAAEAAPVKAVVVGSGEADPGTGLRVVDVRVGASDAVALAGVAASGGLSVVLLGGGGERP